MVLHNSILKFDFEYIMIILRQYSKKNYRKIPKSSKIYIKCHILNCLGFNNYWILLHKINFHWRISMSVNIFPLEVFDFGVSRYSIFCIHIYGIFRVFWIWYIHTSSPNFFRGVLGRKWKSPRKNFGASPARKKRGSQIFHLRRAFFRCGATENR